MEKAKRIIKKTAVVSALVLAGLFVALLIAEMFFRWQIIDFYRTELNALNPDLEKKAGTTILAMGDSFTADGESWVKVLKDSLPDCRIINSAAPGTGIIQASLIAGKRFRRFEPEIFIYQVYAGNDLFDVRYPVSGNVSLTRKFYWFWANHFRILGWMNYAAGKFKAKPVDAKKIQVPGEIEYNARELQMIKAEPAILQNQVMLMGGRENDFQYWLGKMDYLVSWCQTGKCNVYIVFIPHAAQVSAKSFEYMKSLGAEMWDDFEECSRDYAFHSETRRHFESNSNVTVLNALDVFANHPMADSLYYPFDPHLTPKGQKVLGDWLLEKIK